jgi:hypothetical protein
LIQKRVTKKKYLKIKLKTPPEADHQRKPLTQVLSHQNQNQKIETTRPIRQKTKMNLGYLFLLQRVLWKDKRIKINPSVQN